MIIVDIGSGDGKRCIRWLKTFKDALVYAFEPDPRLFLKLKTTKGRLKPTEQRRFKLYNIAVWDSDGEIDFYMCNDASSSSVLPFVEENIKKWKYPPGRYYFKTEKIIKVKCMKLETITALEKIDVIDFLRIDVQGCVKQILDGLGKKKLRHIKEILLKVHIIPFEIYKRQSKRDEVDKLLKSCYFIENEVSPYSRFQEVWTRYQSDVWKITRNAKIYNLD